MAYLTGARAAVVAFLETALPDLQVWAVPRFPDQLLADCLVVAPTAVQPPSVAYPGVVAQLDLYVLCATTIGDGAETALEALLDAVLVVLEDFLLRRRVDTAEVLARVEDFFRISDENDATLDQTTQHVLRDALLEQLELHQPTALKERHARH